MKKVYSSDEIKVIKDLNEALAQLLLVLRKKTENYGSMVKGKIADFTNAAKKLSTIINDKLDKGVGDTGEVMQESFLLSNAKDKITKALIPVKGNLEELKKLYDEGNLSRGRLVKKYAAKSTNAYWSAGMSTKTSNMPEESGHGFKGYSKYAMNIDAALKLLNKALRKKDTEDFELIASLADKLDLISDFIETVLDDSVENKEMVKRVGMLSGEIVALIDQYIGEDSANVEDEGLMNATPDEGLDEDVNIPEDPETGEDIEDDEAEVEVEPEAEESEESDDDDDDKDEEGEDE